MYKILYCRFSGGQRLVTVFDFTNEQIIEFSLEELEKDELTEELKKHIWDIKEDIDKGYYDYSL